jgi:hypothetical protein
MDKLNSRIMAIACLGIWCVFLCAADFNRQHRGVEFHTPDTGELVFFVLYVIMGEIGKKLDKGYMCPSYCEVKHKHMYINPIAIPVDTLKYTEKVLASNN